ncbi:MAG: GNAT family N-acetyltransferase [Pseudomonadota bacterium]
MSSKYMVRQVEIGAQADVITALWSRCLESLTPQAAASRLQHRYLRNPAGVGATLLLEQAQPPEVAGVQCLYSRVFHQHGRTWRVAGMADYAVAESHRTLGPALQLMKQGLAVARDTHDWVYGLANPKSEAVCKRSGLRLFGNLGRWTRLLRSGRALRERLPGLVAGLAAPVLDLALFVRDALMLGKAGALRWQDGRAFDPALDEVWQRHDSALLLSERSRCVLEWRFDEEEHGRWTVSLARRADGTALGYVVWQAQDDTAAIADFLCTDPLHGTALLMRSFAWHMRGHGVQRLSLEFFGAPGVEEGLRRAGYIRRPDERPVYLADGAQATPAPEHWYFTGFDRDGD